MEGDPAASVGGWPHPLHWGGELALTSHNSGLMWNTSLTGYAGRVRVVRRRPCVEQCWLMFTLSSRAVLCDYRIHPGCPTVSSTKQSLCPIKFLI